MEERLVEDQTIIQYLLNELSEEERSQFEERYFASPDIFEQVRAVEEELIDDYVQERLAPHLRARFEQYYLATARQREKVSFNRTLDRAFSADAAKAPAWPNLPITPGSWLQSVVRALRPQRLAVGFGLGCIILMVLTSWLVSQNRQLQTHLTNLREERAALEKREEDLGRDLADRHEQISQLTQELGSVRNRLEAIKTEQNRPSEKASRNLGELNANIVTFVLTSDLGRDRGRGEDMILPHNNDLVRMRIYLQDNEFKSYRAVLQTFASGKEIWSDQNLKARRTKSGPAITLLVPASHFAKHGVKDYILVLSGMKVKGRYEEVDQYYLHVVKK